MQDMLEAAEAIVNAKRFRDETRQTELLENWKHDALIVFRIEYLQPPDLNTGVESGSDDEFSKQQLAEYTNSKYEEPLQLLLITDEKRRPGPSARSRWCINKVPDILHFYKISKIHKVNKKVKMNHNYNL